MIDVLTALRDLKVQATKERSHYYVEAVADQAIREIQRLRKLIDRAEKPKVLGMELIVSEYMPENEFHLVTADGQRHVFKIGK